MKVIWTGIIAALLFGVCLPVDAKDTMSPVAKTLLQSSGATSFSVKLHYGVGIKAMYIGFNTQGKPIIGLAERTVNTYRKARAFIAVIPDGDSFKISVAEIPDMEKFPGKSRDKVETALRDITGKVFADASATRDLVDGVTGASSYYKAIYLSYSVMASKVIKELSEPKNWKRYRVPSPDNPMGKYDASNHTIRQ